jgi:hypothetical protein
MTRSRDHTPWALGLFGVVLLLAAYICVLAVEYYFRTNGVQRHHLESAWMWFVAATLGFALSAPGSSPSVDTVPGSWRVLLYVTVAFVSLAVALYYPVLRLGFLSDDFALAGLAARNQFFGQSWAFLRPVPLMCYKLAGAHPAALHTLVVVLHGLNAALVFRLTTIFGLSRRHGCVAGLLFLGFPADMEAVAWCAGVQDVMMTTGVLCAILAAAASREKLSLLALAASVFSKETAVAAPVLMWLSNRRRWRAAAAGLAVVAMYSAWRLGTRPLAEGYAAAPSSYALKELLVRPFATLTVPFHGAQLNEWPWLGTLLVGGLALLLVRAAWLWRGDRQRIATAGSLALWVIVSVAPVYSMFDVSSTLQGSRYVYLPAAGWSILLAALLMPARSRLDLALVAVVCAVGVLGVRINIAPWTHAAQMRDEVLAAVERARAGGCTAVWIRNVPDSVQGAYVFRNGLADAIAPVSVTPSAQPQCWIAVRFSAATAGS